MPQTTTKFKVTIGSLLILIALLGLAFNQAVLVKNQTELQTRVSNLSNFVLTISQPAVSATPSAIPTTVLKKAVSPTLGVKAVTVAPTAK